VVLSGNHLIYAKRAFEVAPEVSREAVVDK
jgi:hypothetical protein